MRPLRLELKGFTAFRDKAEIDFTELDVFAISGPTGSGKSSLLDAMTYALYGRVERVGDRVGQLISQGQPRMAVTLEFAVGRDRYRVTRSTPARGATKILLERQDPSGEWNQAGEGADRVREAEPLITRAIGLTYDGFTRSVLLPQGKFQEFLVGDSKKRRDILTELLGLSLFRRMAERAGAVAKESADRAKWTTDMVEREFADATPESLKEAKRAAKEAEQKEAALAEAAERVLEILGRWQKAQRSTEELRSCAEEAAQESEAARRAAAELATLAERARAAETAMAECASASEAAQHAFEATQAALGDAQLAWGSATDLGGTRVWAHSLAQATRARSAKETEISTGGEAAEGLRSNLEAARQQVAEAAQAMAARQEELLQNEAGLEEARHADLVATVSSGLKAGDPCPVCGAPLKKAPPRSKTGALDRATWAAEKRRKEVEEARKAVSEAERAADSAQRDVEANAAEVVRLRGEIDELDRTLVAERRRLIEALGDPLPEDPAAEIDRRLAELEQLDQTERRAARDAAQAAQALLKAEQERDRVLASIDRQRDRLVADRGPLFDRAARALGEGLPAIELPPEPDAGADSVGRYAEQLADAMAAFAAQLVRAVAEIASLERRLMEEATDTVGGLIEEQPTLEALARSVNESCRHATSAVATTGQRSKDLASRLERKKQLVEELKLLEERARLFRALALELRADRLIAFLQEEALQVLAAAGSERLASISDGRYRLGCRSDEFFVVDTWNGDEERSVRTLSGGETFLASLALALALADQVRSISSTDRARLDSLFLDEGFGTLDQETLRVVVDAIEQLAGNGRLVGLITHVRELAEQFPRLEVEKSPRGSRLKIVA